MNDAKSYGCLKGSELLIVTFSLSLGIFMNVLDVSIANVAVPVIAGDLAVSADQGTWVITSFAVSQAIMLPITGWLAKRLGEVRLFVFSTLCFTLASFLCGLSPNLPTLVVFRVIQGAVSGPMIPLSQSILLASYPEEKRGIATGLWAMTAVVAPIAGPVLGGWITDNYTWPWIFYINIPIGILSASITWLILKNRETAIVKLPIDYIGLIFLIFGVGCLQILLDNGKDLDWFNSDVIRTLAVISFVSLSFLLAWELNTEKPIIDFTLFAERNFCVGTVALTLGYTVYFGIVVIYPLWLQTQLGYTPTWAGFAAAPIGFLPVLLTPVVGQYMHKFDLRLIASFGFIMLSLTSFWSTNYYTDISFERLIEPRFMQGLGITCFFTPLIAIGLSGLPNARLASASGLANFFRILGGSFGTSLSVTLWERREALHQTRLVEGINPYNPLSNDTINQLQSLGFPGLKSYAQLALDITQQSFMLATIELFWLGGWIFFFLLLVVWLAKPPFTAPRAPVAE